MAFDCDPFFAWNEFHRQGPDAVTRIASVAQLIGGDDAFSTGRDGGRRCGNSGAGRGRTTVGPVARMVRAASHVAERRDQFPPGR
jgi:hypothetical protein